MRESSIKPDSGTPLLPYREEPPVPPSLPERAVPVRLNRALGLWNLIFIGPVIVQPTARMGIYGVISNKAYGHVVTTIHMMNRALKGAAGALWAPHRKSRGKPGSLALGGIPGWPDNMKVNSLRK
jgi:hypothetical protein